MRKPPNPIGYAFSILLMFLCITILILQDGCTDRNGTNVIEVDRTYAF